ncbi:MAG: hypothetical protein ABIR17_11730 [Pseudolysinimonas sp.]|uniref:hypothetical protein n=1 Tax=Pseudolysinimonas sp. TaxID=2680009 RepID=UPI0032676556
MTDVTNSPRTSRLHTLAVVLSSLVIGFPLIVGRLVEAVLDTLNPDKVDVAQPLAYLSQILGFGFGSLGVLLVVIVVVLVVLYRRGRSFAAIRLPFIVLVVQILVGVATLLLSGLTNK